MSKVIGVKVVSAGILMALVTLVPEGHVRRGTNPRRPFRWACNHKSGRLQWGRTLREMLGHLKKHHPEGRRQLIFEDVKAAKAAA